MSVLISRRRSKIHGSGVFALSVIMAETRVCRYQGLLITHEEADALYEDSVESGHTFLFTLNEQYIIDGNRRGNIARWINHSCDPNCTAVLVEAAGNNRRRDRIEIHALRDIGQGEELTFDYGIRLEVRHTARLKKLWACHCGAANCTGTMLKPK